MEKRGIGHIEVIFAFIIFIAAIAFALQFFNPLKSSRFIGSSLPYAIQSISENTSTDLIVYGVKLNQNNITNSGVNIITIEIPDDYSGKNVRVENISGELLQSKSDAGPPNSNTALVSVNVSQKANFILIKFTEDFIPYSPPPNSGSQNPDFYQIASVNSKKVLSERQTMSLNASYYSNYANLKKQLNLNNVDFAFSLGFIDSIINAERNIPRNKEVFSDSRRVEVLRENGKIEFADFNVKIW